MDFELKIASDDREMQQIFSLNHRTFAEEIPQHDRQDSGLLEDAFHPNNTYLVAKHRQEVVGMVSLSDTRPFSLDRKLLDLDHYLPQHQHPVEIRLLALLPAYRGTSLFGELLGFLFQVTEARGYDLALISGTTRQLRLYRKLGFEAFGPLVGKVSARYQPMFLTLDRHQSVRQQLVLP
ncbi:MAG: GNAT family N-acetyltransferase [Salibacteraceae bacterium]